MAHFPARATGAGMLAVVLGLPATAGAQPAPAGPVPARAQPARSGAAGRVAAATPVRGTLTGVTAISARDAWAVGSAPASNPLGAKTLIVHWNGRAWSHVPSPSLGRHNTGVLESVSADSATDAWAVGDGYTCASACVPGRGLILHWNGTAWSSVTAPRLGSIDVLSGVTALSPTDVWAVGEASVNSCPGTDLCRTLILHWDGTAWSRVPSPTPGPFDDALNSVTADSPTDVWAVGGYTAANGNLATLTLRWNGTAWSQVPSPSPGTFSKDALTGVSALSPTDVLAVGTYCPPPCNVGVPDATMAMHWNGTAWSLDPTPQPRSSSGLGGVSATSPTDAWAVGTNLHFNRYETLIVHWNGTAWSKLPSPSPGVFNEVLAVSARTRTDAWAVGTFQPAAGVDLTILTLHWNGTAWTAR